MKYSQTECKEISDLHSFLLYFLSPPFLKLNHLFLLSYFFFHYTTSREFAGSASNVVIDIFLDIILPAALWAWG